MLLASTCDSSTLEYVLNTCILEQCRYWKNVVKTSVIIWGGILIDSTVVSTAGDRAFVPFVLITPNHELWIKNQYMYCNTNLGWPTAIDVSTAGTEPLCPLFWPNQRIWEVLRGIGLPQQCTYSRYVGICTLCTVYRCAIHTYYMYVPTR